MWWSPTLTRLQAYGLSFTSLQQALAVTTPASLGELCLWLAGNVVRTTGEFQSVDEIANILLTTPQGAMVLWDVAVVKDSFQDVRRVSTTDSSLQWELPFKSRALQILCRFLEKCGRSLQI